MFKRMVHVWIYYLGSKSQTIFEKMFANKFKHDVHTLAKFSQKAEFYYNFIKWNSEQTIYANFQESL